MLSYFEEKHEEINFLELTRKEIIHFANKGIIPEWIHFIPLIPTHDSVVIHEVKELFSKLVESSFLKRVLEQNATEFIFHSPLHSQKILQSGKKESFQLEIEMNDWQTWLELLTIRFRQNWNVETPFASFYGELFDEKFRFTLIHESVSPRGISKLFLRRISQSPFHLDTFGRGPSLIDLVHKKHNILIAGSTGSGKTSLLTSLIQHFDPHDHTVVLEDTHEITSLHPHSTNLLSGSSS